MSEILPILANFMLDFCPQKEEFYQLAGKDLVEYVKTSRDNLIRSYSK